MRMIHALHNVVLRRETSLGGLSSSKTHHRWDGKRGWSTLMGNSINWPWPDQMSEYDFIFIWRKIWTDRWYNLFPMIHDGRGRGGRGEIWTLNIESFVKPFCDLWVVSRTAYMGLKDDQPQLNRLDLDIVQTWWWVSRLFRKIIIRRSAW